MIHSTHHKGYMLLRSELIPKTLFRLTVLLYYHQKVSVYYFVEHE